MTIEVVLLPSEYPAGALDVLRPLSKPGKAPWDRAPICSALDPSAVPRFGYTGEQNQSLLPSLSRKLPT
jgi:hypothetical protein